MKLPLTLLFASLAAPGAAPPAQPADAGLPRIAQGSAASVRDWIARPADNICGLRDPDQLSNPSRVQFPTLLRLTPEIRRMREKGIDPSSPEGIQLQQAAVDRVTRACEQVRGSNGYCSVWKVIRHKRGQPVPDITAQVRALL